MEKRIVVFAGNECRREREDYYFHLAYETGKLLAENGFVVVTGGGPGLMNEVAKGAYENGGKTIGVCLTIQGRKQSSFLSQKYTFHALRPRQDKLISLGDHFLALPGGIGTMYEIFAVLSLKRKMEISLGQKLILVDDIYQEFQDMMISLMTEGFVDENIDSLYSIVKAPREAVSLLR